MFTTTHVPNGRRSSCLRYAFSVSPRHCARLYATTVTSTAPPSCQRGWIVYTCKLADIQSCLWHDINSHTAGLTRNHYGSPESSRYNHGLCSRHAWSRVPTSHIESPTGQSSLQRSKSQISERSNSPSVYATKSAALLRRISTSSFKTELCHMYLLRVQIMLKYAVMFCGSLRFCSWG